MSTYEHILTCTHITQNYNAYTHILIHSFKNLKSTPSMKLLRSALPRRDSGLVQTDLKLAETVGTVIHM